MNRASVLLLAALTLCSTSAAVPAGPAGPDTDSPAVRPLTEHELSAAWGGTTWRCFVTGNTCIGGGAPANTCAPAAGGGCGGSNYTLLTGPSADVFCWNHPSATGTCSEAKTWCAQYNQWSCVMNAGGMCVNSVIVGVVPRGVRSVVTAGAACP